MCHSIYQIHLKRNFAFCRTCFPLGTRRTTKIRTLGRTTQGKYPSVMWMLHSVVLFWWCSDPIHFSILQEVSCWFWKETQSEDFYPRNRLSCRVFHKSPQLYIWSRLDQWPLYSCHFRLVQIKSWSSCSSHEIFVSWRRIWLVVLLLLGISCGSRWIPFWKPLHQLLWSSLSGHWLCPCQKISGQASAPGCRQVVSCRSCVFWMPWCCVWLISVLN